LIISRKRYALNILKEIAILSTKSIDIRMDNSIKLLVNQEESSSNPDDMNGELKC